MAIKFYSAYIALTSEIEGYYSNPSSLASYSESNDSEPEENFHIDIEAEDHSPNDSDSEMDEDGDEDDIPISDMLMAEELEGFVDQMFKGFDYDDLRHIQHMSDFPEI